MAWARTVAVVVPSPATSEVLEATSLTSWAPMFSNLSSSSISLATVTPSLVMSGEPNDLSMMTLRPLGPRVTFTASARVFTPFRMALRPSWSNLISFAAIDYSSLILIICLLKAILHGTAKGFICKAPEKRGARRTGRYVERIATKATPQMNLWRSRNLFHYAEDVVFPHDQILFPVYLDLCAGILAEENIVTLLDVDRDNLAVFGLLAFSYCYYFTLLGLLLGGFRDKDPTCGHCLLFESLNDDAVLQRSEFHTFLSPFLE